LRLPDPCLFVRTAVLHSRSIAHPEWEQFGALAPCKAIVTTYPGLSWKVDPISLDGDEGELATRPTKPSRSA
jgi:hypothetical protein